MKVTIAHPEAYLRKVTAHLSRFTRQIAIIVERLLAVPGGDGVGVVVLTLGSFEEVLSRLI